MGPSAPPLRMCVEVAASTGSCGASIYVIWLMLSVLVRRRTSARAGGVDARPIEVMAAADRVEPLANPTRPGCEVRDDASKTVSVLRSIPRRPTATPFRPVQAWPVESQPPVPQPPGART